MLLLFQLVFTYLPPMQALFGTAAIDAEIWLRIVLVAAPVLCIAELEKPLVRRWSGAAGERGGQPARAGNPR